MKRVIWLSVLSLIATEGALAKTYESTEIVPAPVQTPWDSQALVEMPFPEYPRMQLIRDEWKNLNGRWNWAVTETGAERPAAWSGTILVPFPFESELSGVNRSISEDDWMWYHREFEVPDDWNGRRVWLNFQASDWETVVYVNGREVGHHQEGYTPFGFDITDALKPGGSQELVVRVWDHQGRKHFVSAGKQLEARNYEPSSGIWQTVWLEPRTAGAIEALKINASLGKKTVELTVTAAAEAEVRVEVRNGARVVATGTGSSNHSLTVEIPNPEAWAPDNPFLYDLRIDVLKDGRTVDTVMSYFGLRDIRVDKSREGPQIVLNGKALFQFGPLDQGYWPLSTLTPPTDEAQKFELQYIKDIGGNMVRLHGKRNPSRWYYYCDTIGLLVWQDFIFNKAGDTLHRIPGESERWKNEQLMLMDSLNNHPSVVKWIVFNEAWGQHDTGSIVQWAQNLLPNHIVSAVSGWNDVHGLGDIRDVHDYERFPSLTHPGSEPQRAVVLGETGGFGVPVNGNNWLPIAEPELPDNPEFHVTGKDRQGGMKPVNASADRDFVTDIRRPVYTTEGMVPHYERYIASLWLGQTYGLSAGVYTQLTDMRHEQNGWLTFDRKVSKIPVEKLREIHLQLYRPLPKRQRLVTSPSGFAPSATTFIVEAAPQRAALNIELTTEDLNVKKAGFLRIFLDGDLILDDKTRHVTPERRVSSILLTESQVSMLTPGEHELEVEVDSSAPFTGMVISLDTVEHE